MDQRVSLATRAPRTHKRDAILLAAEKLFAQHGYHSVSLREIASEAGVPLALVGYYFGPKQDLFYAIFAHWSSTIDERLRALKAVQAGASNKTPASSVYLRRIVEAFVGPVLRLRASSEGEYYALLVARELSYRTAESDRVLREFFDPLANAFIDAIHALFPTATRVQAAWTYQFALGALLHHISSDRMPRLARTRARLDPAAAEPLLVSFIEHGIKAALKSN